MTAVQADGRVYCSHAVVHGCRVPSLKRTNVTEYSATGSVLRGMNSHRNASPKSSALVAAALSPTVGVLTLLIAGAGSLPI